LEVLTFPWHGLVGLPWPANEQNSPNPASALGCEQLTAPCFVGQNPILARTDVRAEPACETAT